MDEITSANAEADTNSAGQSNLTVQQLANRRLGQLTPSEEAIVEEAKEISEEEVEQVEEVAEQVTEQVEQTESEENVLSQLDFDNLSEEELRELSEKLGSRAVARFGEMTAKRKAAEEKVAQLESMLQEKQDPLNKPREIKDNPFSDLDTIEKLQEKADEVNSAIEWAEDLLFESDGYAAEDIITEVDGEDLTKSEVRKALLNARKAQKQYLPDQLNKVQQQAQGQQLKAAFGEQAKKELEWLNGEDNDTRKHYEATVGDPRYKKLKEVLDKEAPEIGAQIEYWFAHATNSIYGRKLVQPTKSSPSLNPTKTGIGSAAQSEKSPSKSSKALKDLEARYKQTGNPRDFAALRKLQLQKK
jgi:hypothetical protein